MTIIYNIVFLLFSLIYFPYFVIKQKWHPLFFMRFGKIPPDIQAQMKSSKRIWVHAVSVGEVLSVAGLLRRLKKVLPEYHIVLTTVTKTGYQMANSIKEDNCTVLYAPLDLSWVARRYLQVISPTIYISAETEIWPNLFHVLMKNKIPIVQVNGRISKRSFAGYKLVRFIIRRILQGIKAFCMQSQEDAQRIIALGVDKEKVMVVGNIKFDDLFTPVTLNRIQLGLEPSDIIFVAGSTHPGEEEIVLEIYRGLIQENNALRLIIAPRHIERIAELQDLIKQHHFNPILFSQRGNTRLLSEDILLVDTIGHLRSLYGLADIAFVGKSLTVHGGHNIIEPAYFGKPILIGPFMENFQKITQLFVDAEAVIQIQNKAELLNEVRSLVQNPSKRELFGQRAQKVIKENQGATEKTLHKILEILKNRQTV